jgi:hypothetical protein
VAELSSGLRKQALGLMRQQRASLSDLSRMFDADGYEGIGVAAEPAYGKPEAVRAALTREGQYVPLVGRGDLLFQRQQKTLLRVAAVVATDRLGNLRTMFSRPRSHSAFARPRAASAPSRASSPAAAAGGSFESRSGRVAAPYQDAFDPSSRSGWSASTSPLLPSLVASRWIVALHETRSIRVNTEMRLLFFLSVTGMGWSTP